MYPCENQEKFENTTDGVITEDEKPDLEKIINTLNEVNEVTQNLKNWIEKSLKYRLGIPIKVGSPLVHTKNLTGLVKINDRYKRSL